MARPYYTQYYFNRTHDLQRFEHVSTDGKAVLDDYVGETIAAAFCDGDSALDLVRFHRSGEQVVVQRRLTDIVLRVITFR